MKDTKILRKQIGQEWQPVTPFAALSAFPAAIEQSIGILIIGESHNIAFSRFFVGYGRPDRSAAII